MSECNHTWIVFNGHRPLCEECRMPMLGRIKELEQQLSTTQAELEDFKQGSAVEAMAGDEARSSCKRLQAELAEANAENKSLLSQLEWHVKELAALRGAGKAISDGHWHEHTYLEMRALVRELDKAMEQSQ